MLQYIEEVIDGLNDMLGKRVTSYVTLQNRTNKHTLVCHDASLVSVYRFHGALEHVGQQQFDHIISTVANEFASRLSRQGHCIQVFYDFDPDDADNSIRDAYAASMRTATTLGITEGIDAFLEDWIKSIAAYSTNEDCYIALWTNPRYIAPVSRRRMRKRLEREFKNQPYGKDHQRLDNRSIEIIDAHNAFVHAVGILLEQTKLVTSIIPVDELLYELRRRIDPEVTGIHWRPRFSDDKTRLTIPEQVTKDPELSHFLQESIPLQLFPRNAVDITYNILRIGNTWHATFVMATGPREVRPFTLLFKTLLRMKIPWRINFVLKPHGLRGVAWKGWFTRILHFRFLSENNPKLNNAFDYLHDLETSGDTVAQIKIVFSTYVKNESNEDKARQILTRRIHDYASAVQSWGGVEADYVIGDPLLGLTSALPAMIANAPAQGLAAPLMKLDETPVAMLPLTRPAAIWENGSVLFRTPDGKLMPYAHLSSKQAAWIEIGVAPMGQGKSVMLNTMNWGFILQAGLSRLPWVSTIDIGPSSKGVIDLLQSLLPENMAYIAIYRRLRMEPNYAINVFDTPLGFREPYPSHMTFLVNFLSLIATSLNENAPTDGVPEIARACILAAYREYHDDNNPKPYIKGIDEEVDRHIDGLALQIEDNATWWEIVDALYEANYPVPAMRAQRYAIPTIADVAAFANQDIITGVYKHETPNKERVTEFFWRSCLDAIKSYPILGQPTQFDIGNAQIVALDLDEVAPRGSPEADRQTGIMYMLARHITAGRMFLMPDDAKYAPSMYQEYHVARINHIRQDPKRISYDEVHRVVRNSSISQQLISDMETIARESRKWNMALALYTQSDEDIPKIITELATTVLIMGANAHSMADRLADKFGLNDGIRTGIMQLGLPGAHGANFVGIFKTSRGHSAQFLTNTVGTQALWAFSTVAEDQAVRNALYDRIGIKRALIILSKKYPSGIKKEIERRKVQTNIHGDGANKDIIEKLIEEMIREETEKTIEYAE